LDIAAKLMQLSTLMNDTVHKAENIDELKLAKDTGTASFSDCPFVANTINQEKGRKAP